MRWNGGEGWREGGRKGGGRERGREGGSLCGTDIITKGLKWKYILILNVFLSNIFAMLIFVIFLFCEDIYNNIKGTICCIAVQ